MRIALANDVRAAQTRIEVQSFLIRRTIERRAGLWLLLLLAFIPLMFSVSACSTGSAGAGGKAAEATLHLDTFVVNLADPGQRAYVRAGIDLGLSRPIDRRDPPPLGPVRDAIIAVLGQAKSDDLLTADGKTKLKQDLLHALQQRGPALGVEEVYFTEFLIQR